MYFKWRKNSSLVLFVDLLPLLRLTEINKIIQLMPYITRAMSQQNQYEITNRKQWQLMSFFDWNFTCTPQRLTEINLHQLHYYNQMHFASFDVWWFGEKSLVDWQNKKLHWNGWSQLIVKIACKAQTKIEFDIKMFQIEQRKWMCCGQRLIILLSRFLNYRLPPNDISICFGGNQISFLFVWISILLEINQINHTHTDWNQN